MPGIRNPDEKGTKMATRILLLSSLTLLVAATCLGQTPAKTRLAVVGLDHDHVWGLLKVITEEPDAEQPE